MFGEGGKNPFIYKSADELKAQVQDVQSAIGEEVEHDLLPPQEREAIFLMSEAEIKKKYARRYEIYLRVLRAQADGGEPLVEEDIGRMRKWIAGLNSLERYVVRHNSGEEVTLRERQLVIFKDLRNFLEQGGLDGYIKLPTGVGKTVLFIELVEALDMRTLIVVPTQLLVEQTKEKLHQFAAGLEVGRYFSGAKEIDKQVVVTTYDSLVASGPDGVFNQDDFDCVILDEVHTSLSEKRMAAVNRFEQTIRIGFTATPEYSYEKKVSNLLKREIHQMGVQEAVEENSLASFSSIVAKTTVDLSSVRVTDSGEFSEKELEKAVNIAGRNKAAVDLYKKSFDGQLAVVYCVGIDHAVSVAEAFEHDGISASVITGDMSIEEQQKILKEYESGECRVLCNADLLIAGFDQPKASVCLNLRPTRSRVVAEQRGGRVLRLDPQNPMKHSYVVDFLDANLDERKTPVLFADVVDGVEFYPKKKGVNRKDTHGDTDYDPTIDRVRVLFTDVPGIRVVTDVHEIMRIVNINRSADKKKELLTLTALREQVRMFGIKSGNDYEKRRGEHVGWPAYPGRYYDNWPGWDELLGRESIEKEFLPLEELQKQVRDLKIKTGREYVEAYKAHKGWPQNPAYSCDGWLGWEKFLGTEPLSFSVLRSQVRAANIQTSTEYFQTYKQHLGWPGVPSQVYGKKWSGWVSFLGTENRTKFYTTYVKARYAAQKLGAENPNQYVLRCKIDPLLPSKPERTYSGDWERNGGWNGFLFGKEFAKKDMYSFDEAVAVLKRLGIQNWPQYNARYKEDPRLPSSPKTFYDQMKTNGEFSNIFFGRTTTIPLSRQGGDGDLDSDSNTE